MRFRAFGCQCGYQCVTPEEKPKCKDCGKKMVEMDTDSEEYKTFDKNVRNRLGLKCG
jgi:hypothetical protein